MIDTILLIVAAVCFALVALKIERAPRFTQVSLLGAGLLAWVLTGLL